MECQHIIDSQALVSCLQATRDCSEASAAATMLEAAIVQLGLFESPLELPVNPGYKAAGIDFGSFERKLSAQRPLAFDFTMATGINAVQMQRVRAW